MPQDIAKLSGSAARLLLAYLSTHSKEDINTLVNRAGIVTIATWRKANKELEDGGFFVEAANGTRYVNLCVADCREIVLPE